MWCKPISNYTQAKNKIKIKNENQIGPVVQCISVAYILALIHAGGNKHAVAAQGLSTAV